MLAAHLRGHILWFDREREPTHTASAGTALLIAATLLEALRATAVNWWRSSIALWWLVAVPLVIALLVVPRLAGGSFAQFGLRRWREWTTTEKSYFVQVLLIANVVFPLVLATPLARRVAQPDALHSLATVFLPYLLFGFYQELVYRGLLQRELVRRWGAVLGILVANVLYTFGPLHWNYFGMPLARAVPMFAAVFAIGLYFGALYRRSGNLWMVGTFHAIGNAYIVWSVGG